MKNYLMGYWRGAVIDTAKRSFFILHPSFFILYSSFFIKLGRIIVFLQK